MNNMMQVPHKGVLVVKTPPMDEKNVNFPGKLGHQVQKNCINSSSISKNAVFDGKKYNFSTILALALLGNMYFFYSIPNFEQK